ncbi:MAG: beta-galactosidase [Candidatus Omnitrophica bacterium]|nr:beta-galactosidase [Candidatus Omnitrophota bacterium]
MIRRFACTAFLCFGSMAVLLSARADSTTNAAAPNEVFLDFEQESDLARLEARGCRIEIDSTHPSHGQHSLKVTFLPGAYPTLVFKAGKAYLNADWRNYYALDVDLYNPEASGVPILWQFMDSDQADGAAKGGRTITGPLRHAGWSNLQVTPLGLELGVAGLLLSGSNLGRVLTWGHEVDPAHILRFQMLLEHADRPVTIYIDNLRFSSKQQSQLVDRFGQYTRRNWKGKIHHEDELATAGKKEAGAARAFLADSTSRINPLFQEAGVQARFNNRDTYGGSPVLSSEATGFFRTAWVVDGREIRYPNPESENGQPDTGGPKGRWWLVTPEGHPFFSLGITGIVMGDQDLFWKDDRRKALLEWMPPHDGPFSRAWAGSWTGGPNFYKANLVRKYDEEFLEPWAEVTIHRLIAWGFNTIGGWSDGAVSGKHRLPYATFLTASGTSRPELIPGLPDMFDPRFAAWSDALGKEIIKRGCQTDRWLLGYFVDNELFWAGDWGRDDDPVLAQKVLALPSKSPGKQALINLLQERFGSDIAKLNQAWQTDFPSFDPMLSQPVTLKTENQKRARADFSAFITLAADTYFRTVRNAIRKYDPHHLYLGSRFAQAPREAVAAAGKYCDVVSFNIYADQPSRERFNAFYRLASAPFLVGEWSFGARDRGMLDAGAVAVDTQEDRGRAYAHYLDALAGLPYFVGCHWFLI